MIPQIPNFCPYPPSPPGYKRYQYQSFYWFIFIHSDDYQRKNYIHSVGSGKPILILWLFKEIWSVPWWTEVDVFLDLLLDIQWYVLTFPYILSLSIVVTRGLTNVYEVTCNSMQNLLGDEGEIFNIVKSKRNTSFYFILWTGIFVFQ